MALITRLFITLLGAAFAVLMTLGVLCWLVLFMVFACVRWLLTGQKPQVVVMWQQVNTMRKGMQTRQQTRWHEKPGATNPRDTQSDVVEDVVVREIRDKPSLPKD